MIDYVLDTNACIALINGAPAMVRDRLTSAISSGKAVGVPAVVSFELHYGARKSTRRESNEARLARFFAGPLEVLPFTDEDAESAGEIRADLEAKGTPIGAYDVLIAGQARRLGAVLVTSNVSEFGRVKTLRWEDWGHVAPRLAKPRAPKPRTRKP